MPQHFLAVLILLLTPLLSFNTPTQSLLKEANLMTNVKAYTSDGKVKCEVICTIKTNNESLPPIEFQIGKLTEGAGSYSKVFELNSNCNHQEAITIKRQNDTYRINFGQIYLEKNFKARLVINETNFVEVHNLELVTYQRN